MTIGRAPRTAVLARDRGGGPRRVVLRPEECMFAAFLAVLTVIAGAVGVLSWPAITVAITAAVAAPAAAIALLRRRWVLPAPVMTAAGTARASVPFAACAVIYLSLREITPRLDLPLADPSLIAFDRAVFGGDVSRWLDDTLGVAALTLVMTICYLSYGLSQAAYAITLHLRGRVRQYRDFSVAIAVTAVVGYTGYLLVPGVGPHLYQAELYADPLPGQSGALGSALNGITAVQGPARDLFPSLHTAMTVVLIVCLWRDARRWFWWYLPLGLGLLLSTVYLRKHYLVDVLAGIVLAALAVAVARPLNRWWYETRSARSGGPPPPR